MVIDEETEGKINEISYKIAALFGESSARVENEIKSFIIERDYKPLSKFNGLTRQKNWRVFSSYYRVKLELNSKTLTE